MRGWWLALAVGCGGSPEVDADGDGFVAAEDCDDDDASAWPGAPERCDNVDHDCDGSPTDGAADASTWFLDADGDGYGDPVSAQVACEPPTGFVARARDCDDAQPLTHPDARDLPLDGEDSDCDGVDPKRLECVSPTRPLHDSVVFTGPGTATAMRELCSRYDHVTESLVLSDLDVERPLVTECLCRVDGDVVLTEGGAVTSLVGARLDVGGTLSVAGNPHLESLQWAGDLNRVEVQENPELTTIDMVSLQNAVGGLDVRANPALTLLEWTSQSGVGSVTVLENGGAEELVVELGGDLWAEVSVRDNPGLTGLSVGGVPGASGTVRVQSNPELSSLTLETASVLGGDLIVTDHPSLTSLLFGFLEDPLSNLCRLELREVQGSVVIERNPGLRAEQIGWTTISSDACLHTVGGSVVVADNGGLDGTFLGGLTTVGGDVWVSDLDANQALMHQLEVVGGNVSLVDVRDYWHVLTELRSVGGDLLLWDLYAANDLDALEEVQGDLLLLTPSRTDRTGPSPTSFRNLASIGGDIEVSTSTSFAASALQSVGGTVAIAGTGGGSHRLVLGPAPLSHDLALTGMAFHRSDLRVPSVAGDVVLQDCSFAETDESDPKVSGLVEVGGALRVWGPLPNLWPLGDLETVGGVLDVEAADSLVGLEKLTSTGMLAIRAPSLADYQGLDALTTVGTLSVGGGVRSLSGMTSLASVQLLSVSNATRLEDLAGLEALTGLDELRIWSNLALTSLDGLEGIESVGYAIDVWDNPVLTDVSALLGVATCGDLAITENPALAAADAGAVGQAIDVFGVTVIENNGG